jgi:putative phosphoribosyl transferase
MHPNTQEIQVIAGSARLEAFLSVPEQPQGVVLFAHGSGSSRHSRRNQLVAKVLQDASLGTLLVDLLTPAEEQADNITRELRFDINLLAQRLLGASDWLRHHAQTSLLPLGYFGASTGGGAALKAAARRADVRAVVSRGGRPDLAADALPHVTAPTLLIVGGDDEPVIALNRHAYQRLRCEKHMEIVPGATHLFEEKGKLEIVAGLARDWFMRHLHAAQRSTEVA